MSIKELRVFDNYSMRNINGVDFTAKEFEVLACLVTGQKVNKQIAFILSIREKTAQIHIGNILKKIGCNSREQVIDRIKESDKQQVLIDLYNQKLLPEALFKETLEKIILLIKKQDSKEKQRNCLIIYSEKHPEHIAYLKNLVRHLSMLDIKISTAANEQYKNLKQLLGSAENTFDICLCIVPWAGQSSSKFSLDLSVILKQKRQLFLNAIFLVIEENANLNLVNRECIEFKAFPNYYVGFFELIKKIWTSIDIEAFSKRFQQMELSMIFQEEHKTYLNQKATIKEAENGKKSFMHWGDLVKQGKRQLFIGIFLCITSVLSVAIMWKEKTSTSSQIYESAECDKQIRSELTIPKESAFLQRPYVIKQIEQRLIANKKIKTIALVGVTGIGGAGKTTLARYYAKSQKSSIIWELNAETKENLLSSFKDLAYSLATTNKKKEELDYIKQIQNSDERDKQLLIFVKNCLKNNPDWLLIYDNIENVSDIKNFLPIDSELWGVGKVIVTTRDNNISNNSDYIEPKNVINIQELSQDESLILFCKILYSAKPEELPNSQVDRILSFLINIPPFPLDISIAAYYIRDSHISFEQYLERVHESIGIESVQENLIKEKSNYAKTRYGVISLSLNKIVKRYPEFKELLFFISLLESQNVPKKLLEIFKDSATADLFMHELRKYSLITEELCNDDFSTFSLHRSTQDNCRKYIKQNIDMAQQKKISCVAAVILEKYLKEIVDKENIQIISMLEGHCFAFLSNSFLSDDIKGNLKLELGCLYYYLGESEKAKLTLEKSLFLLNKTHDDIRKAQILMYLGTIYRDFGQFTLSKQFLEKSLNFYQKSIPKDQIKIAQVLSHLGNVYKDLCEPEKAKKVLEESLLIYKNNSNNSLGMARTLAYLGTIYREFGQYKSAQECLNKSVSIYDHNSGNPLGLALTLARLGNLYREIGEYKKAIECLEKSLVIYKKNSSKSNIYIGWVLVYLGLVYQDIGDYEKARDFIEQGLSIHKRNYSKDNINVGWLLTYLGNTYIELKNYEKAAEHLEKSLDIYEKNCSSGNINIGWACLYLGIANIRLGKFEKAKNFFKKSHTIYERYFTANNTDTTWVFPYNGDIFRALDLYTLKQFPFLDQNLISLYEQRYGNNHLRTALIFKTFGCLCITKQEYEKAEIFLNRALQIFEKINHPDLYIVLENLALISEQKVLKVKNKELSTQVEVFKKQADNYLRRALIITQNIFPHDSLHIRRIKLKLEKISLGLHS